MGSGNLFKTIISLKKGKDGNAKQVKGSKKKSNGFKWRMNRSQKSSTIFADASTLGIPIEDLAAIRIQTAFRAYKARRTLRRLKGTARLQTMIRTRPAPKKEATSTLNHLHSWCNIQSQIRARRDSMVSEGRLKKKKMENQLKLEAKLHDVEVEWSGGPESKDELLGRIHLREKAVVMRERAMAYAFTHQWRAYSNYNGLNNYVLAKENWGWSWVERWIAARPWESRVLTPSISPNKAQSKQANKVGKKSISPVKALLPVKGSISNGRGTARARRLTFPPDAKKRAAPEKAKDEEKSNRKEPEEQITV